MLVAGRRVIDAVFVGGRRALTLRFVALHAHQEVEAGDGQQLQERYAVYISISLARSST